MLNIEIKGEEVIISGSLDFLLSGDRGNIAKLIPTYTEFANCFKSLIKQKMNPMPKVNLDTSSLDNASNQADDLISKLKTIQLLIKCINETK